MASRIIEVGLEGGPWATYYCEHIAPAVGENIWTCTRAGGAQCDRYMGECPAFQSGYLVVALENEGLVVISALKRAVVAGPFGGDCQVWIDYCWESREQVKKAPCVYVSRLDSSEVPLCFLLE